MFQILELESTVAAFLNPYFKVFNLDSLNLRAIRWSLGEMVEQYLVFQRTGLGLCQANLWKSLGRTGKFTHGFIDPEKVYDCRSNHRHWRKSILRGIPKSYETRMWGNYKSENSLWGHIQVPCWSWFALRVLYKIYNPWEVPLSRIQPYIFIFLEGFELMYPQPQGGFFGVPNQLNYSLWFTISS